jgi:hypothetical protein
MRSASQHKVRSSIRKRLSAVTAACALLGTAGLFSGSAVITPTPATGIAAPLPYTAVACPSQAECVAVSWDADFGGALLASGPA